MAQFIPCMTIIVPVLVCMAALNGDDNDKGLNIREGGGCDCFGNLYIMLVQLPS